LMEKDNGKGKSAIARNSLFIQARSSQLSWYRRYSAK